MFWPQRQRLLLLCLLLNVLGGLTTTIPLVPGISSISQENTFTSTTSLPTVFPSSQATRNGNEELPCPIIPEIVLVQDVSASYENDMHTMRKLVPQLIDWFSNEFHGVGKFGIVSFTDKNVASWGSETDFCAHLDLPLTRIDNFLTRNVSHIFEHLQVGGGKDYLDGADEALLRAALSDEVGWSSGDRDPLTGWPVVRVLLLATDAGIHQPGYHMNEALSNGELPRALPPNRLETADLAAAGINTACANVDYPSGEHLAAALRRRSIVPIVFAGEPSWSDETGSLHIWNEFRQDWVDRYPQFPELNDPQNGLCAFYRMYFREALGFDIVVEALQDGSANFMQILKAAMQKVTIATCNDSGGNSGGPPSHTFPENSAPTTHATSSPTQALLTTEKKKTTTTTSTAGTDRSTLASEATTIIATTIATTVNVGAGISGSAASDEPSQLSKGLIVGLTAAGGAVALGLGAAAWVTRNWMHTRQTTGSISALSGADSATVEIIELSQDRDQFEAVTGDLFA